MANILGINLSELTKDELLLKLANFLNDGSQHYIVTPNPEIILSSHEDEEFFYILNNADLSLPDGFGLILAARIFGTKLTRLTGADTTIDVLKMAQGKNLKITILNWEKSLSQVADIEDALKKQFPNLTSQVINIARDKFLSEEVISQVNNFAPSILFNTLGFPYQEKLMYHNLAKLPSVKLALGIGGSFDYLSGRISRGPKIFRQLGLEWLWRLLNAFNYKDSGRRIKRIFRATFVFLEEVFRTRFINPYFYRPNVACWLYKKDEEGIKVLVVKRRDQNNHWQLPQGGTDGESLEVAGARELREELNTDKFLMKAVFKNVHRYKFKERGEYITNDAKQYKFEHKGQKQGLFIAEFTGQENDLKINFWDHQNYKWVKIENLISVVHEHRKLATTRFLEKFNSLNIN